MLFSKWDSDLISFLRQELLQSPSLHWCHWMGLPLQIPRHPRGFLALHNGLQKNKFYELVLEWKSLLMHSKSSCRLVLYNRGALKMFTEFTETHMQQVFFIVKFQNSVYCSRIGTMADVCLRMLQNFTQHLFKERNLLQYSELLQTHCTKKRSFPLRISSVNVTKFAVSCGFGQTYYEILNAKPHFLIQWHLWMDDSDIQLTLHKK